MKIQEASKDITRRRNSIQSPKTSYMEETQKGEETSDHVRKKKPIR